MGRVFFFIAPPFAVVFAEVLELLFANVRQPDDRRGDLGAMEGACRIAERRLHAMADRFGDAIVPVAFEALLNRGEQRMRDAIARLPDGVYAYQTYLDNSRDSAEPLLLRLKLTVAGDELHADFTGSAPQVSSRSRRVITRKASPKRRDNSASGRPS